MLAAISWINSLCKVWFILPVLSMLLNGIAMGKTSPIQFLRQVKQEVKKVTWPSKKEVMRATVMVLVIVAIASTFFFLVDMFFAYIVRLIFQN